MVTFFICFAKWEIYNNACLLSNNYKLDNLVDNIIEKVHLDDLNVYLDTLDTQVFSDRQH